MSQLSPRYRTLSRLVVETVWCQEQTISELTPLLVLDRLQHKVEVHHVV